MGQPLNDEQPADLAGPAQDESVTRESGTQSLFALDALPDAPPADALPAPKRRGRPPKVQGEAPRPPLTKKSALAEGATTNALLAQAVVNITSQLMVMSIGPEWMPEKLDLGNGQILDEQANLIAAYKAFLDSKGQNEISPGTLLAITVIPFALRRMQVQNTRSKFAVAVSKIKNFTVGIFSKIGGAK